MSLPNTRQIPLTGDTRGAALVENETEDGLFGQARRPLPPTGTPHQSRFQGTGGAPQVNVPGMGDRLLGRAAARSSQKAYTIRTRFLPDKLKIARHTGNTTHIRSVVTDEAPRNRNPEPTTHPPRTMPWRRSPQTMRECTRSCRQWGFPTRFHTPHSPSQRPDRTQCTLAAPAVARVGGRGPQPCSGVFGRTCTLRPEYTDRPTPPPRNGGSTENRSRIRRKT